MADCDTQLVRGRAIALLLSLVFGGVPAGCGALPSLFPRPLSNATASRDGGGGVGDGVERAQFVPGSEATPGRDPPAAVGGPDAPISLAEAVAYGLRHNPRLRQASAQVAASREGAEIAFAPFLPEVNYEYVYAAYNRPVIPGGAFVSASIQRGTYSYSLNEFGIQWRIPDFGRRGGRYDQALSRARAESLVLQRARQTVAFDVATAYFRLLAARAEVRVREEV